MNFLEERIVKDGVVKPGNVLKVDSFLNHQMDIALLEEIGREFKRRFGHKNVTKVMTIEASGIGIAAFVAKYEAAYGEKPNQFAADGYDAVYAIFEAMKAAKEDGKTITTDMTPSEICEILKEQFTGDFTFSGNTGTDIKWQENGYVNKGATAISLK